ncbi:MAG: hypothetical protein KBT12_04360 [Bacteroidales bacterium]|nr:hypothetical protein [Candidatus Physcousia equi]
MNKPLTLIMAIAMAFASGNTPLTANDNVSSSLISLTASASLQGKWITDAHQLVDDESANPFKTADLIFEFTQQKVKITMHLAGKLESDGIGMDLGIKMTADYGYTKKGNTIELNANGSKPQFNLYKFKLEVDAETREGLKAAGITDEYFKKEFEKQFTAGEMNDLFNTMEATFTITSLTPTTLVLTDTDGESLNFKRTK